MSSVILFGAYNNGNIGDTYQAESVGRHLLKLRPNLKISATGASSREDPFEFTPGTAYEDASTITDYEFVNSHDALVIGGGGLLASVHRPLNSEEWLRNIKIPIIVLAVGANDEVAFKSEKLLKEATYVSARDEYSLRSLRKFRPDTHYVNDPILSDDSISSDRAGDIISGGPVCLIPRKMSPKNQPVYQRLHEELRDKDFVMSMFPSTDKHSGALDQFPGRSIVNAMTMDEMVSQILRSSIVLSERYHGGIIATRLGVPCIGLVNREDDDQSKIANMFRQIGMPELCVSMRSHEMTRHEAFDHLRENYDWAKAEAFLTAVTADFRDNLEEALRQVGL